MREGQTLNIGGRDFIIPALSFGRLKRIIPLSEVFFKLEAEKRTLPTTDEIDSMVQIVQIALEPNYPDIKKEELEELLTPFNMVSIIPKIFTYSGMSQTATGVPAAGELVPTSNGAGQNSIPT